MSNSWQLGNSAETVESASVAVIDCESDGTVTSALLEAGFRKVVDLRDLNLARSYLDMNSCQLVVLDVSSHDERHARLLNEIAGRPECAAIVIGSNQRLAAASAQVAKPVDIDNLVTLVRHVLKSHLRARHSASSPFARMLTRNSEMMTLFRYAESVASSNESVLITGETGTGKELMATAIHACSRRKGEFVALNIAGLEDGMIADTLFGHRKGSYTGAEDTRAGLVLRASAGTLFLDEIGDLGIASQVKLLRLLQEGEYFPLGCDVPKHSTARILVATSRDFSSLQAKEHFRPDLFFRLRTHHLHLPPLRERSDDLPLLCEHFLRDAARVLGRPQSAVSDELLDVLRPYAFPGNVRELRSLLFDAVGCNPEGILSIERIRSTISYPRQDCYGAARVAEPTSHTTVNCRSGVIFPAELPTLSEVQDELALEAVRRVQGSQTKAARLLGISRQALNQRLRAIARRKNEPPPSDEASGPFPISP
jgi:two-component system, NtrC family, nitrogen regulation response regulator GlnG